MEKSLTMITIGRSGELTWDTPFASFFARSVSSIEVRERARSLGCCCDLSPSSNDSPLSEKRSELLYPSMITLQPSALLFKHLIAGDTAVRVNVYCFHIMYYSKPYRTFITADNGQLKRWMCYGFTVRGRHNRTIAASCNGHCCNWFAVNRFR